MKLEEKLQLLRKRNGYLQRSRFIKPHRAGVLSQKRVRILPSGVTGKFFIHITVNFHEFLTFLQFSSGYKRQGTFSVLFLIPLYKSVPHIGQ